MLHLGLAWEFLHGTSVDLVWEFLHGTSVDLDAAAVLFDAYGQAEHKSSFPCVTTCACSHYCRFNQVAPPHHPFGGVKVAAGGKISASSGISKTHRRRPVGVARRRLSISSATSAATGTMSSKGHSVVASQVSRRNLRRRRYAGASRARITTSFANRKSASSTASSFFLCADVDDVRQVVESLQPLVDSIEGASLLDGQFGKRIRFDDGRRFLKVSRCHLEVTRCSVGRPRRLQALWGERD